MLDLLNHLPLHQPQATLVLLLFGGALAQLFSAWVRLPSIVFLLLVGFLLGPEGLGWVRPDLLETFRPVVIQLLVAVIMFEGGLSLRLREVREHGRMVRQLLTLGVAVTFIMSILLAVGVAEMGLKESVLFSALVVVTGPTVILPLLKRLGAQERIHSILKWEGILVDPLGGILAVLCLELVLSTDPNPGHMLLGFTERVGLGAGLGLATGSFVGWLFQRRFLLGHGIQEMGGILGLSLALIAYGLSEMLMPESGLVCVTFFGILLGHTKFPYKHEIVAFKGQVTTVAISTAFIWLSSSILLSDLRAVLPRGAWVVAALMFVVRPLSVWISSWRTDLTFRQKAYLSLISPRGIVAASFAFFVADSLAKVDPAGGRTLVPLIFLTIIASVLWAGLLGGPLATWLGVKEEEPRGLLIVGANALTRLVAGQLVGRTQGVKFIDNDAENCRKASQEGFFVYSGDSSNQKYLENLDLKGVGKLLAATNHRDTNILACQIGARLMGTDRVFRLDAREWQRRGREAGSESWGLPLSHIPLRASDLVEHAEKGRLVVEWRRQDEWLFRIPTDPPPAGPWPLLAVYKGMVIFPGERWIPKGVEWLEISLKPGESLRPEV